MGVSFCAHTKSHLHLEQFLHNKQATEPLHSSLCMCTHTKSRLHKGILLHTHQPQNYSTRLYVCALKEPFAPGATPTQQTSNRTPTLVSLHVHAHKEPFVQGDTITHKNTSKKPFALGATLTQNTRNSSTALVSLCAHTRSHLHQGIHAHATPATEPLHSSLCMCTHTKSRLYKGILLHTRTQAKSHLH